MAKVVARIHNDEAIEKSVDYYNFKVKAVTWEEGYLVLLKIHNFLGKDRKLAEKFKCPFIVVKVNENGTVKIKTKYAKHDQLVNQNLLVKYKQQKSQPTVVSIKNEQNEPNFTPTKRILNKPIFEEREDGGPVTRLKKLPEVVNCKHQAKINLIPAQKLMDSTINFG